MNKKSISGSFRSFRSVTLLNHNALAAVLLAVAFSNLHADSATWSANPVSGDWNTPENWVPNTVPNGPADTATFGASTTTDVYLSSDIEVDSIKFDPGASAYTIRTKNHALSLSGTGIVNYSGVTENFAIRGDVSFHNSASAGTSTEFNVTDFSTMSFYDASTAGNGIFFFNGEIPHSSPTAFFYDSSTAANGTFTLTPGLTGVAACEFFGSSSAGNGVFTAGGSRTVACAILFFENSTADDATITAGAGVNGGNGGEIFFGDDSSGGNARVILFGHGGTTGQSEGNLTTQHNLPGLVIGSLEGNGLVEFTDPMFINLVIGSNNLSSTFSGLMEDFFGGSRHEPITKIGTGTLTLSGTNDYTGPVNVQQGTLLIDERFRLIKSKVHVDGGELGGTGTVLDITTIGTGTDASSLLSPGMEGIGTFTFRRALRFASDGAYNCELNSDTARADKIVAQHLTINSGALISLVDLGATTLPTGTIFTIIDNTSADPIVGEFSNLIDGANITAGNNTFQASYEGGDGNDLTLTVVP